jgi:hypothetical protein
MRLALLGWAIATARPHLIALSLIAFTRVSSGAPAVPFTVGELVRLTRGEMVQFNGKDLAGSGKGQVFTVLKHDVAAKTVFVGFANKEGALVAVSVPAVSLEAVPPTPWVDLASSAEAFRDGRYTELKPRMARASKDPELAPLISPMFAQMNGAITASGLLRSSDSAKQSAVAGAVARALGELRDTAAKLASLGYPSLALALDQGTDRLAAQTSAVPAPPTKLNREALTGTVAAAQLSMTKARQAVALNRGIEALGHLEDGLKAEPARPDFKAMRAKVQKDIAEAGDRCNDADSMRRFPKGAIHALTAIEMGLKLCSDHPRLRALRKEMEAQFEERTAPPVTAEFLANAGGKGSEEALKAGHKLYTSRCTECHELELLDSRSIGGWRTAVSSMAGRAHLNDADQGRILEYLTIAQRSLRDDN